MVNSDAQEAALARWWHALVWLVVSLGVFWCWWISWQEGKRYDRATGPDGEPRLLLHVATPDPGVMRWLPAAAGLGSLIVGLISAAKGHGSLRFLVFAAMMTGMKAVTVSIDWLLRH